MRNLTGVNRAKLNTVDTNKIIKTLIEPAIARTSYGQSLNEMAIFTKVATQAVQTRFMKVYGTMLPEVLLRNDIFKTENYSYVSYVLITGTTDLIQRLIVEIRHDTQNTVKSDRWERTFVMSIFRSGRVRHVSHEYHQPLSNPHSKIEKNIVIHFSLPFSDWSILTCVIPTNKSSKRYEYTITTAPRPLRPHSQRSEHSFDESRASFSARSPRDLPPSPRAYRPFLQFPSRSAASTASSRHRARCK